MIEDFDNVEDGTCVKSDLCIVGAGAAGITIAREFLGTHYKITVLESGGLDGETETQKLYQSEIVGLPHTGIHAGRARVFGGTTTLWGGQALRFSDFDLQKRDWVPFSGWPLSRADLDPYYERADRTLQLGAPIPYEKLCATFGVEPPAFDPSRVCMQCSQWSPRPNFGTAYQPFGYFKNRYELYGDIQARILDTEPIDYLEFGVRNGDSIFKWATLNTNPNSRFIGFDSFEGLPEDWVSVTGTAPKGSFSVAGVVPATNDPRVRFIKGWFCNTLRPFLQDFRPRSRLVIHNDADLYSSTLYTLSTLDPLLRPSSISNPLAGEGTSVRQRSERLMYTLSMNFTQELGACTIVPIPAEAIRTFSSSGIVILVGGYFF